ncbi:MAG TPA: ECF-type sigma factor [Xanthomonadales bacterium]|nr:ECF-type sigma factor [Xanthomonadales bacterium]
MDQDTVGELLRRLGSARAESLGELMAVVQADLRAIAHRERMLGGAGPTLSTTALVNEAWLKLREGRLPDAIDRRMFFGIAARAMRQVLVDYARERRAAKRGGGRAHDSLSAVDQMESADPPADELLALDDALAALERTNQRAAEVVQLRYFGGLADAEIGEVLGVDESTVRRDWLKARGWLHERLKGGTA